VALTANEVTGNTIGGTNTLGNGEELNCGNNGGGSGALERVYIFTPPAAGQYEISVQGDKFRPLLHLRRQSCQGEFIDCAVDPTTNRRPRLTVNVTAPIQPIAIGVDGDGATQKGSFTLTVTPRLPDLRVSSFTVPAQAVVGAPLTVELEIENAGELAAGSFVVEAQYARDASLAQPLGSGPATCRIAGLAAGGVTPCRFDVPLSAPFVAAGNYVIGVTVDAQREVRERGDDANGNNGANNRTSEPSVILVPGGVLDQQVFRGSDGTAYQVVRVLPSADPTAAEHFRITTLVGGSEGLTSCASADSFPGGAARAVAGATSLPLAILRTAVLEPSDVVVRFDPAGGGRVTLGSGATRIDVPEPLVPYAAFTDAGGGMPGGCTATVAGCGPADEVTTIGFGIAKGPGGLSCANPDAVTVVSEVCREEPEDGFVLEPGQSVVFIHRVGLGPLGVGVGGFGINLDEQNESGCTSRQIVDARAIASGTGRQPLLTFVEAQNQRRFDFSSVVISGDGTDAYVGDGSGQVLRFDRNPTTGSLTLVQTVKEGEGGVGGLTAAAALALSPDGRHLYVASGCRSFCNASDDALVVFARDTTTGALTFVQALRDGVGGVDGLAEASAVAVSPDGAHVYGAGAADDALAVFARDPTTGRLTFVQVARGSLFDPPANLSGPRSIAISGTGAQLYVACTGGTVVAFSRSAATGHLTPLQVTSAPFRPVGVALGPGDSQLYVASGISFRLPSGTPNQTDGVWVYTRNADGTLAFLEALGDAVGEVGTVERVRAVALHPNGGNLQLLSAPVSGFTQRARVANFTRNLQTGRLTFVDNLDVGLSGLSDNTAYSFGFARSPDGAHTYVVGGTATRGVVARLGGADFVTPADGPDGLRRAEVAAMTSTGSHLYVGSEEALVTFARDATTGHLTALDALADGSVTAVAVAPGNGQVYSLVGAEIRRYLRNVSGLLQFQSATTIGPDGGIQGEAMVLSPSGSSLYAATSDAIWVYARDGSTGALSFVETISESSPGIPLTPTGLEAMAILPSGTHLYVVHRPEFAESDPPGNDGYQMSVSELSRNLSTGRLTFVRTTAQGGLGPEDRVGGAPIAIDADRSNVYIARGTVGSGVVEVYGIDINNQLTLVETQRTGVGAAAGFAGAKSLALSPDGRYLFVTGGDILGFGDFGDDAVAVFARALNSGRLTFLEQQRNGVGRIEGIDGPAAVVPSPDGKHVYVVSDIDNGVAVFAVNE
jgi:6-phosphogluconolactonase (cycloisomerase 2 family)